MKQMIVKTKTLEQQLLEAEAEVKRLKTEIENNKPKNGDICLMDNGSYKFIAIYESVDSGLSNLKIQKINDKELLEKLNNLIK